MKKIGKVFEVQSDWASKVFIGLMIMVGVVLVGVTILAIQSNKYVWWLLPVDIFFVATILHPYFKKQFFLYDLISSWISNQLNEISLVCFVLFYIGCFVLDELIEKYEKIETYQIVWFFFYLIIWIGFFFFFFNQR